MAARNERKRMRVVAVTTFFPGLSGARSDRAKRGVLARRAAQRMKYPSLCCFGSRYFGQIRGCSITIGRSLEIASRRLAR